MNQRIKIFPSRETLNQAAAEYFIMVARKSIQDHGIFSAALSGGSTPEPVYRILGSLEKEKQIDWDNIHLFWGDERCVPPDHPDSNYRMVRKALLDHIRIPEENIHRVPAEYEPHLAAQTYEAKLRDFFKGDFPQIDLVFLGMGDDGHTASLFPHSAGLKEEDRWFIENYAPIMNTWRLTLSKNAINAARHIAVLVVGESKAGMLVDVLEGDHQPDDKPIQLIDPKNGQMVWFLDQAAAKKLSDQENEQ
jgi:6-phosphogluconolactonase